MTLSAHKLGGPTGVGALVVRRGVELRHPFAGGAQETGRRPGTEAVGLIAAFAAAAEESVRLLESRRDAYVRWNDRVRTALEGGNAEFVLNTPARGSLPNTLNVSFPGRPGPALVHRLDLEGVSVSYGSACTSGSLEPSAVLLAMGASQNRASSAVRISFGPHNSDDDIALFLTRLTSVLEAVQPRVAP